MASWAEGLAGPWAACVEREAPQFPPPTQGLGSVSFWTPPKRTWLSSSSLCLPWVHPPGPRGSLARRRIRNMERAQETRQRQGPASREPGPPLGPGGCGGRSRAQVEGVGWRSLQGHGRLVQEPTAWEPVRSQGRNAGGAAPLLLSGPAPKPVCLTSDFPRNPVQPSLPLCIHPMTQWEGGSLFLATRTQYSSAGGEVPSGRPAAGGGWLHPQGRHRWFAVAVGSCRMN